MTLNIMLDLETMGTGPQAAIVAIGAVVVNRGALDDDRFYVAVDLESAVQHGGHIDAGTVLWWLRQCAEARDAILHPGALPLPTALQMFSGWLHGLVKPDDVLLWGNGADFDNVILANAYRNTGLPQPWGRCNNRCYRTVKQLRPDIKLARTGTHHNALDDAESQALHLVTLFDALASSAGACA